MNPLGAKSSAVMSVPSRSKAASGTPPKGGSSIAKSNGSAWCCPSSVS
jgi:hypothetical protein